MYELELKGMTVAFLEQALARVGELISRFHLYSEEWVPSKQFLRHRFDLEGFLANHRSGVVIGTLSICRAINVLVCWVPKMSSHLK